MTWDDLRLLLAVAERGGVAAAARSLELEPARVREGVAALEKSLGAELLAREGDGLPLSAAGERAVATARRLQAEISQLADDLAGNAVPLGGTSARSAGHSTRARSTSSRARPAPVCSMATG
jgi:DNA-binding transcriptional LysR family regulator